MLELGVIRPQFDGELARLHGFARLRGRTASGGAGAVVSVHDGCRGERRAERGSHTERLGQSVHSATFSMQMIQFGRGLDSGRNLAMSSPAAKNTAKSRP